MVSIFENRSSNLAPMPLYQYSAQCLPCSKIAQNALLWAKHPTCGGPIQKLNGSLDSSDKIMGQNFYPRNSPCARSAHKFTKIGIMTHYVVLTFTNNITCHRPFFCDVSAFEDDVYGSNHL